MELLSWTLTLVALFHWAGEAALANEVKLRLEDELGASIKAVLHSNEVIENLDAVRIELAKMVNFFERGIHLRNREDRSKVELLFTNCESAKPVISCDANGYKLVRQIEATGAPGLLGYTSHCAKKLLANCIAAMAAKIDIDLRDMDEKSKDTTRQLGKRLSMEANNLDLPSSKIYLIIGAMLNEAAGGSTMKDAVKKKFNSKGTFKKEFKLHIEQPCRQLLAKIDPNAELFEHKYFHFELPHNQRQLRIWAIAANHCKSLLKQSADIIEGSYTAMKEFYD